MIERGICEAAFREAVIACDPSARVREALDRQPVRGRVVFGLAIGKAAFAMARGVGSIADGLIVAPPRSPLEVRLPLPPDLPDTPEVHSEIDRTLGQMREAALPPQPEWGFIPGDHPIVGERSLEAGDAAIALVEKAAPDDVVLALISGGASALVERPRDGMSLDEFRARVHAVMASGAPIHEINRVRTELSAIKGGKLAALSKAPVVTLVVSDVIGDDPRVIGSGPMVTDPLRDGDRVEVIAPIASFGIEVAGALVAHGVAARRVAEPIAEDVAVVADRLAAEVAVGPLPEEQSDPKSRGSREERDAMPRGVVVAWGEPTVRVPDNAGSGGRAQQLALELAKRLRGTSRSAFVAGSDGIDGPSLRGAAGAYVDGATWDAIIAAKLDPDEALRRCDAGTVLDAVGALIVTGPTGINHADVVILG